MLVLTLLVLCAGSALGEFLLYDLSRAHHLFENFVIEHGKNYYSYHEKQRRFKIFKENLIAINEYNTQHDANIMGINLFSDMSKEEFARTHLGCSVPPMQGSNCTHTRVHKRHLHRKAPESFDWRDHGVVTPVKNQGGCGACWAFSTIGNIESQYALKHKVQLDLSEQQEVDCDRRNSGCGGGWMTIAVVNLMNEGGLMAEEDYPYVEGNGQCQFDPNKVIVKVDNCLDFSGADEESIKDILVNYGPLTIALSGEYMQQYQSGVLTTCDADIDHALLLVGYGTDQETNTPYWLIKNSWSEMWGEEGFLRLKRGNPDCQFGQYALATAQVA